MKRFVWRLQRVLDIKTQSERKKRIELLGLTERLAESRGRLLMTQRILNNIIEGLSGKGSNERLSEQEFFMKYSAAIDGQIKILKQKVAELESKQREKIAELLKIKRFKEGLDRLREQAKRHFIKEQEKLEQKQADEQAGTCFVREKRLLSEKGPGRYAESSTIN